MTIQDKIVFLKELERNVLNQRTEKNAQEIYAMCNYINEIIEDLKTLEAHETTIKKISENLKTATPVIMPGEEKPKDIIVVKTNLLLHSAEERIKELKTDIKKGIEEGIIILDHREEIGLIKSINGVHVEIQVLGRE